MNIEFTPMADADTVAAALAALACYIEPSTPAPAEPPAEPQPAWRSAGLLAAQGLPPTRRAPSVGWAAAERVRREAGWSFGIVGL